MTRAFPANWSSGCEMAKFNNDECTLVSCPENCQTIEFARPAAKVPPVVVNRCVSQIGLGTEDARVIAGVADAAEARQLCGVAAEKLRLEPKPLGRDIERRQIKRLQLRLIVARMQACEVHRAAEIDTHSPLIIFRQPRAVVAHLDIR